MSRRSRGGSVTERPESEWTNSWDVDRERVFMSGVLDIGSVADVTCSISPHGSETSDSSTPYGVDLP